MNLQYFFPDSTPLSFSTAFFLLLLFPFLLFHSHSPHLMHKPLLGGVISRCQIRRVSQLLPTKDRQDMKKLWLLIIPVTTFCLGTWQIFRLQWKVGLIEELERKTMRPAVDIPTE